MINSIINTFVFGGRSSFFSSSLSSVCSLLDDYEVSCVDTSLSLSSVSTASLLLNGCGDKMDLRQVEDTYKIVESMSLEELYELRDLTLEKENSLKLEMRDI